MHRFFHLLGAGSIEEVRVTRDKGFGFVRYSTHDEAAVAIQTGNGQLVGGRQIKVLLSSYIALLMIKLSPVYWTDITELIEFLFLFKSCSALGEASQLHQGQLLRLCPLRH